MRSFGGSSLDMSDAYNSIANPYLQQHSMTHPHMSHLAHASMGLVTPHTGMGMDMSHTPLSGLPATLPQLSHLQATQPVLGLNNPTQQNLITPTLPLSPTTVPLQNSTIGGTSKALPPLHLPPLHLPLGKSTATVAKTTSTQPLNSPTTTTTITTTSTTSTTPTTAAATTTSTTTAATTTTVVPKVQQNPTKPTIQSPTSPQPGTPPITEPLNNTTTNNNIQTPVMAQVQIPVESTTTNIQ